MSRSQTQYFEGGGQTTIAALYDALVTEIEAHTRLAQQSWQLFHTFATRDLVFKSVGDPTFGVKGDAALYVRFDYDGVNTIRLRAYQDFTTAGGGAGSRVSSSVTHSFAGTSGTFAYWGGRNEYEVTLLLQRSSSPTTYTFFGFGSPVRAHLPPLASGVGFSTGAVAAGTNVVVPTDRDLSTSLTVNQTVWIYDLADPAAALPTPTVELPTVVAVTPTDVTLSTLTNPHANGAIIGFDPCPMVVYAINTGSATPVCSPNDIDGTTTNAAAHTQEEQDGAITPSANDPNDAGWYVGCRAVIKTASVGQFRGFLQHVSCWPPIGLTNQHLMRVNLDDAHLYRVFPSSLTISGFARAVGPGAPFPP